MATVEDSCEHGNEPSGSIKRRKFLSSCTTGGFSRRAHVHGVVYYNKIDKDNNIIGLRVYPGS
jgi:hypothetical protein